MSIKDLVVSKKEAEQIKINQSNWVMGNCEYCGRRVYQSVLIQLGAGKIAHEYCAEKEYKKLKLLFVEPVKKQIRYKVHPKVEKKLKISEERWAIIERELVGYKTISFYLFGREYTIKLKRHSRLEDLLTKNGKKLLKYKII